MTIYVDNAHLYLKCSLNVPTSHLFADTPEELHEMAKRIGLDRSAFQGDPGCYDVNATERADAIRLGAKEVTKDEAFKLLQSLKEAKKRSLKEARHARGTAAKNSRAEWLMGERITRALALTAFLIASGMTYKAHAQGAGDPARGREYARQICARCHAIRKGDESSPHRLAPGFEKIANTAGVTGMTLAVILHSNHEHMPNWVLATADRNNVIAYILSLKRP